LFLLQQSVPHFVPVPGLQTHVACLTFWALHVCSGPQHAVVFALKQQVVPFVQHVAAPLGGWQTCPPYFSHGWHSPSTHTV
jgi:hypothetical protein